MSCRLVVIIVLLISAPAMAIDLAPLWDFNRPDVSEQRLREALATATEDDALILNTQIARTYGLRKDFARAQELLKSIEKRVLYAGPEARARYALELGRTYVSATHVPTPTSSQRSLARASYEQALEIAKDARLDDLAIDAIHMMAFVDTTPVDQLKWAQEALQIVEASSQPKAKTWEASIQNNIGYALHQLGRFEEALDHFNKAVAVRQRGANAEALRVAHWMVAWTLRSLGRLDEALEIQLRLERECEAARAPDRYVYEELENLYRALGNEGEATRYGELRKSLSPKADITT